MSRRRPIRSDYMNVNADEREETDGFEEQQFRQSPRRFPWKAVLLIMGFLVGGIICLTFAILTSTGYFEKKYEDRAWPLFILGILMFIPGGYYGYILLCICLQRDGFTLEDVPLF